MVDMTCELHDEVSAGSQFVTHLTGRILERLSLRTTPINTKAWAGAGLEMMSWVGLVSCE